MGVIDLLEVFRGVSVVLFRLVSQSTVLRVKGQNRLLHVSQLEVSDSDRTEGSITIMLSGLLVIEKFQSGFRATHCL